MYCSAAHGNRWFPVLPRSCSAWHRRTASQRRVNGERSLTVSYGELDLTSLAGAEALYRRIRKAAFTVCGAYDSPMPWSYTAKSTVLQDCG